MQFILNEELEVNTSFKNRQRRLLLNLALGWKLLHTRK